MTSPRERIGQPEFSCLGRNDVLSIKSRPRIGVVASLIVSGSYLVSTKADFKIRYSIVMILVEGLGVDAGMRKDLGLSK